METARLLHGEYLSDLVLRSTRSGRLEEPAPAKAGDGSLHGRRPWPSFETLASQAPQDEVDR